MAKATGVGDPLIGGGWVRPDIPGPPKEYQGIEYDFTGTYNSATRGSGYGNCVPGVVYPYSQLAGYMGVSRGNHTKDVVPWVPNVVASFDPRPAAEKTCSFAQPNRSEWTATLRLIRAQVETDSTRFGFPLEGGGVQPAFTIYACNEFSEGKPLCSWHYDLL